MSLPNLDFGAVEHMAWWKLQGRLSLPRILTLGKELSELTGMTLDGEPDVRSYPTTDGKGGVGYQVYFAWVESWLLIGTFPQAGDTGIVRVAMSTCKFDNFVPAAVQKFLVLVVGPVEKYGFAEW